MSDPRDDGGPAFPPLPIAEIQGRASAAHDFGPGMSGRTLRDYFAAKAMAAFIISPATAEHAAKSDDATAEWAYKTADAMLKERAK